MTIEFDDNITSDVQTCFRGLPTDKMEKVIEELKEIQAKRLAWEAANNPKADHGAVVP